MKQMIIDHPIKQPKGDVETGTGDRERRPGHQQEAPKTTQHEAQREAGNPRRHRRHRETRRRRRRTKSLPLSSNRGEKDACIAGNRGRSGSA